jgi:hypothetical protein
MRFGILRNIAGNIEALQDADRRFNELGVDIKVCLGQIARLYPYVDECVAFLISEKCVALGSKMDKEFAGRCDFEGASAICLVEALNFARNRVSRDTLQFLETLPERFEIIGVGFETLAPDGGFLYEPEQIAAAFAAWRHRVTIHARDFDPVVWSEDLRSTPLLTGLTRLDSGRRLLISTGGVGSQYQGSVNTREPCAMLFDDFARTAHILRPMCHLQRIIGQLRSMDYPRGPMGYVERWEYEVWR